jgi:hypothetical protein
MGAYSGGEIFKSRVQLYPYPIGHEHFMTFNNQFQSIYKNNEFIHRYYAEKGNFSFLLLIHTSKLPEHELSMEIIKQYLNEYPNLRATDQGHDLYTRDFYKLTLAESPYPLHWQGSSVSYIDFISGNYVFNLVYLIFIIILWYMGGYQIIATRFEFRFFLFFFFFTYSIYVGVLLRLETNIKNREVLHLKAMEKKWQQEISHTEKLFTGFLQKKARHLSELFRHKRNPFREKEWPENFMGIIMRRTGFIQPHPDFKEMDNFSNNLLLRIAPALMAAQLSNQAAVKSPEFETIRQKIKRDYKTEKHFNKPNQLIQSRMINNEGMLLEIINHIIMDESRARLSSLTILQKEHYIFWEKLDTEPIELLVATAPAHKLQIEFFQELLKNPAPSELNMFIDCESEPGFFAARGKMPLSVEDINNYWELFQRRYGLVREFNGQRAAFFRSLDFSGFRYFFIQPFNINTTDNLRRLFELHIWIIFFYASLLAWLLRNFFINIIKTMMTAFREWKNGVITHRISIKSRDFSAGVFRAFNLFAGAYEHKHRSLPPINPAIEELFTGQGNALPVSFSGQATLLYCAGSESPDFKNHCDKQKKAHELWLAKAEKYGGLLVKSGITGTVLLFFEKNSKFYQQNALQAAIEVAKETELYFGLSSGNTNLSLNGNKNFVHWFYGGELLQETEKLCKKAESGNFTRIFVSTEIYENAKFSFDFTETADSNCYEVIA